MKESNESFSSIKIAYKDLSKMSELFLIKNAEKNSGEVTPNTGKCMATRMKTLNTKP